MEEEDGQAFSTFFCLLFSPGKPTGRELNSQLVPSPLRGITLPSAQPGERAFLRRPAAAGWWQAAKEEAAIAVMHCNQHPPPPFREKGEAGHKRKEEVGEPSPLLHLDLRVHPCLFLALLRPQCINAHNARLERGRGSSQGG